MARPRIKGTQHHYPIGVEVEFGLELENLPAQPGVSIVHEKPRVIAWDPVTNITPHAGTGKLTFTSTPRRGPDAHRRGKYVAGGDGEVTITVTDPVTATNGTVLLYTAYPD